MDFIFLLIVLIFSVVIHEVSHGYAARALGDPTAEEMGRLTLNPLAHLDPFGSVVLPFTLYLLSVVSGTPPIIFGWAKPVPYNPLRLRNLRWGPAGVAIAGPASNITLAILFGAAVQLLARTPVASTPVLAVFGVVVLINLILGVFNLVPIPPLDSSKILFSVLPDSFTDVKRVLEQYGWFILLAFIFFGGLPVIYPIIGAMFRAFTGGALPF